MSTSEIFRRDREHKEAKRAARGQRRSTRLLRPKHICAKLDIGKTLFWEKFVKKGRIKLVNIGPNAVAAPEDEIDELIEEIIKERDEKLANTKNGKEKRSEAAGTRTAEAVAADNRAAVHGTKPTKARTKPKPREARGDA